MVRAAPRSTAASAAPMLVNVLGIEIPPEAHTLDGFRAWVAGLPEEGPRPRATFCDGGIHVEMSPQDHETHGPLVAEVNAVLRAITLDDELGVYFFPPSWFTHRKARVSTEPDGFLVRTESFESGRVRINPRRKSELLGAPDMTLEVVSASSPKKDRVDLLAGYARAGVGEYWLIDARSAAVDFRMFTLGQRGFEPLAPDRGGWLRSPTYGRRFRLRSVVNVAGLDDFRLDVRRR